MFFKFHRVRVVFFSDESETVTIIDYKFVYLSICSFSKTPRRIKIGSLSCLPPPAHHVDLDRTRLCHDEKRSNVGSVAEIGLRHDASRAPAPPPQRRAHAVSRTLYVYGDVCIPMVNMSELRPWKASSTTTVNGRVDRKHSPNPDSRSMRNPPTCTIQWSTNSAENTYLRHTAHGRGGVNACFVENSPLCA